MKRIISILLACMMLVSLLAFTGCNSGKNKYGLMEDGVLIIGMEASYEPFEMIDENGEFVGYDVDMAKKLGEKLGVEVKFINTGFDGILDGIGVNYDCVISALTVSEERKEQVLFTDHYVENYQAIVVKKGSDKTVEGFDALNESIVWLQEGTTTETILTDLKEKGEINSELSTNPHIGPCFDALKNGEADFVVCDSTVAVARLAAQPDEFEIAWQDDSMPEVFAVAVAKDNTELADAMNKALKELKEEGLFEDLDTKWFSADQSAEETPTEAPSEDESQQPSDSEQTGEDEEPSAESGVNTEPSEKTDPPASAQ